MIALFVLDPALSSRLCLMLFHSLWQVALLAAIAWGCERLLRCSVERRYLIYVAAMITSLLLLPVTFAAIDVGVSGEAIARPVGVDAPQAISLAPIELAAPLPGDVEMAASLSGPAKPQAVDDVELAGQQAGGTEVESPARTTLWTVLAPWLAAGYVAGVGLMLLRLLFGVWSAQRLVVRSRPASDPLILLRLEQLVRRLAVGSRPVLAYSEQVLVPRIVGLLRPVILLPTSAMTGLAPEQVDMVLAHELTHLRRHDLWVNLLQRIAEAALFFNPSLWYLSHRIHVLREYACDDAVCRTASEGADDVRCRYAAALLQIAELSRISAAPGRLRRTPDAAELTTLAASGRSPSQLRRRIARLLGEPLREPLHLSRGSLLMLCAVALAVVFSSSLWPAIAQTDESEAETEQRANAAHGNHAPRDAVDGRVEVIAMSTVAVKPQRWWDASGELINPPAITWKPSHDVTGDARQWRRIVIRVHDLAENEEVRWEMPGIPQWWGADVTVDGEASPPGYYLKHFIVPEGQQNLRMRVGIASGKWQTVSNLSTGDTLINGRGEPSFISSGVFEKDGGTSVLVAHDVFQHNFRIVAIDKQGHTHDSGDRGGSSIGKVYQSRVKFPDLPLEQIDHFEFQTRPYEWTEIDDLPLEPLKGGHATVETSEKDVAVEPEVSSVDLPVVVAEHVLLLEGREVIRWDELEEKIAALPDPSVAYPRFYITRGARDAGLEESANEQMSRLHREYKLRGLSVGSLWPRSDLRYDSIRGAADLVADESLRIEGRVVDADGNAVEGAEVIVITPIDESISYRAYHMALVNGRVRNRLEHVMSVTDAEGRFAVYPPKDTPFTLVTLHPEGGFAFTGGDQLAASDGLVRLLQWASLTATFTEDEQSQQANVSTRVEEAEGRPEVIVNQYWSDIADRAADATFRFTHVPPIFHASVSRSFPTGQGGSVSVTDLSVSLLPGEDRQLPLGPMSDQQRQQLDAIRRRSQ